MCGQCKEHERRILELELEVKNLRYHIDTLVDTAEQIVRDRRLTEAVSNKQVAIPQGTKLIDIFPNGIIGNSAGEIEDGSDYITSWRESA